MEHALDWRVRPKRKITKPCLDYSQVLLREEEQALKKALYVSLRHTKSTDNEGTESRSKQSSPGSSGAKDDELVTTVQKRKRRKKNAEEKKARKELFHVSNSSICQFNKHANLISSQDVGKHLVNTSEKQKMKLTDSAASGKQRSPKTLSPQESRNIDETSQDTDIERAKKCLQVQRKFAQSQPCSPNSLMIQQMGLVVPERPKTEDFIKFLCLRGTSNLPKELEYLNNPLVPCSPLSSDEDEFLPVSPFFKRQINNSESKSNKHKSLEDDICDKTARNLDEFMEEANGKQQSVGDKALNVKERDNNPLESSSAKLNAKEDIASHENVETESLSSSIIDQRVDKKDGMLTDKCRRIEGDGSSGIREDKVHIPFDLSDSSSQESAGEKKSRNSKGWKFHHAQKVRRFRKSRNKETEPNLCEERLNAAPIFRPMEQEFKDPVKYIKKIVPFVLKYGICVIVPPAGWQASTNINDDLRFSTKVQHIHKMANRNSKSATHLKYLKRCLGEKSELLDTVPQIGSCEVDLQQMSDVFASVGGVAKVNTPRKWQKMADNLHLPKHAQGRINKLQDIYYKYVLPFDMLTEEEKEIIKGKEAKNDIEEDKDAHFDSPEFKGKSTSVSVFHRMASNAQEMYAKGKSNMHQIENDFWDIVEKGDRHVAAVSGEIDSINVESANSTKSKSGWNLSTLPHVHGSVLKYLGHVPGLTTSHLQFSSVFSCSEWQKNEDDLLTVEYLHTGAKKIWYAVPSFFKQSFEEQKKEKFEDSHLTSPLSLECPVSRIIQNEGQFVVCLPNVYRATLSCGYCLSESCNLATIDWLIERFNVDSKSITPSLNFPVEKIILALIRSEFEKLKKMELIASFADMIKEIRRDYFESMISLSDAGIKKNEHLNTGKHKRISSHWEECSTCDKPCYLIMVEEDRKIFCPEHAISRVIEDEANPASFVIKTQIEEVNACSYLLKD